MCSSAEWQVTPGDAHRLPCMYAMGCVCMHVCAPRLLPCRCPLPLSRTSCCVNKTPPLQVTIVAKVLFSSKSAATNFSNAMVRDCMCVYVFVRARTCAWPCMRSRLQLGP